MLVLHEWLKDYCGDRIPSVKEIENLLTFHAFEIEGTEQTDGHDVIDVKVLPDRAADCLSHRGIAREIATLTGIPLVRDPLHGENSLTATTDTVTTCIENANACNRFAIAHVRGVKIGPSPEWLASRLRALGQRSINNVVDATNYVMLALGQPLHAYDAKKLTLKDGVWQFGVRMAKDGEVITTLTGDTYTLTSAVQIITDGHSDAPIGIAGIKGGKTAEIDELTTDILIEAAHFDPQITRKASQYLKLQTDASKRFENNPSPELVPCALAECVRLICEIANGTLEGYSDMYTGVQKNNTVSVSLQKVNALLGLSLSIHEVEEIFKRLEFSYEQTDGGWHVTAPFDRRDILIAEDVIAEIGRVHGYEHIASVIPAPTSLSELNARFYYSEKIRTALIAQGFSEVITSSFRNHDVIELQNALASDKGCLRSSLAKNLIEVLDRNMPNADLLGVQDIRVFEIGTVFGKTKDATDVSEHVSLAIGVRTKQQGYSPKDDTVLAGILANLEGVLSASITAHIEKGVMEINLTELITQLHAPTAYDAYVPPADVTFVPYSTYPFISRDIALWVNEGTSSDDVVALIRAHAGDLLIRTSLFDEFAKEGRVSYAFRLVFQSHEKTLTDEEVGTIMERITNACTEKDFTVR